MPLFGFSYWICDITGECGAKFPLSDHESDDEAESGDGKKKEIDSSYCPPSGLAKHYMEKLAKLDPIHMQ